MYMRGYARWGLHLNFVFFSQSYVNQRFLMKRIQFEIKPQKNWINWTNCTETTKEVSTENARIPNTTLNN